MSTSTNITIRTDADIKRVCEGIYGELGVSLSTAINVFLRKSIAVGGFPFDVRLEETPNRATMEALLEAEKIVKDPSTRHYKSAKELFADLENGD